MCKFNKFITALYSYHIIVIIVIIIIIIIIIIACNLIF